MQTAPTISHLIQGIPAFGDLTPVRTQDRHATFSARDIEGQPCFIKAATQPDECLKLKNEVEADRFLMRVLDGRVRVPHARDLIETHAGCVAVFEAIEGQVLAQEVGDSELLSRVEDTDLADISIAMLAMHRQTEKDVPAFFLDRANREFTWQQYNEKLFVEYLNPCTGRLISDAEALRLQDIFREKCRQRRFVHHDIALWNLIRSQDGDLVLVDAEYARWGMKWYDQAYFFLQTYIMLGDRDLARRALLLFVDHAKQEFPDQDISSEIFGPLAYRLGANLWVALKDESQAQRAKELLPLVLAQDLDGLIGQ